MIAAMQARQDLRQIVGADAEIDEQFRHAASVRHVAFFKRLLQDFTEFPLFFG